MKSTLFRFLTPLTALIVAFATVFCIPATAQDNYQQELVDQASLTINEFLNDQTMTYLRNNLRYAKGVLIMPSLFKAAFWIGGSGGRGLLMVRDPRTNDWSGPAFYTIGGGSVGVQFGASSSEVVMMVMTQSGIESLYTSTFKLGGGVSAVAGPVGIGAEGATAPNLSADFLSFARSKGVFIGAALDGAVISVSSDYNQVYYGQPVRPVDVFEKKDVHSPGADKLRAQLANASKR
ncbi:MAG: lipid-binding SYLF domain-containing protein [Desulfobacterales bacterium]|nr:lipid-binding SYLF domain-containing protein [Desulfobacterales bacterium]